MKKINDTYQLNLYPKSDIYRKFQVQFKFLLSNPPDNTIYVPNINEEKYKNAIEQFANTTGSDIMYLIGYTGVGKSTLLRKYLHYTNRATVLNKYSLVIPISWDSIQMNATIERIIGETILNAIREAEGKSSEEYLLQDFDDVWEFYNKYFKRSSLSDKQVRNHPNDWKSLALSETLKKKPLDYSIGMLLYALHTLTEYKIEKVIFVIDDLETLAEKQIIQIYKTYWIIWSIWEGIQLENKPTVNFLFGLRPHSFKYLQNNSDNKINAFYNFLQDKNKRLRKDRTPDIRELFKERFKWAMKNTKRPGNLATWKDAYNTLNLIIDDFDRESLEMVQALCHYNIRSIVQWFEMILSNRIWCQEIKRDYNYPKVNKNDYRFDVVNIMRTLACGEMPIYTGNKRMVFHSNSIDDIQEPPSFDGSKVFIPNLMVNLQNSNCDVLPLIIMRYYEFKYGSQDDTDAETEFISKRALREEICELFDGVVTEKMFNTVIDYLFINRIFRKSIICRDSEKTTNKLSDEDCIYLTSKGSALLKMLMRDSVLLEIYREDIARNYSINSEYDKPSYYFINEGGHKLLFKDLIKLCYEIYCSEDNYQSCIDCNKAVMFYSEKYAITNAILNGVETSMERSKKLSEQDKEELRCEIAKIKINIIESVA